MGQFVSFFYLVVCPHFILKEGSIICKGKNSCIYALPNDKVVCKVVYNYHMFLREKKFIQQMKFHKKQTNIIQYYQCIPGHTIFLMERADQDLLEWMQHNYLKKHYSHCLKIWMGQLACGYRFLAANGIEHYDIKPDNLLLVGNVLKIADFGTCQMNRDKYVLYTGTYGFIAPELVGLTNQQYYVPHSMDVYSICLMVMYIRFAPIFKKFHYGDWTLEHYLLLEKFVHEKYPFCFFNGGLIVDQRHRLSITELLNYMEEGSADQVRDLNQDGSSFQEENFKDIQQHNKNKKEDY